MTGHPMLGYPMLENICNQPQSHRCVIALQQDKQHAALIECAKQIRNAKGRVILSGMGASLFAALPAVSFLEQHGYRAQVAESAELLHFGSAALRCGDVGVLISRSGGSIEVLRLAEKMRSVGVIVIGVTNVKDSQLASVSDICLLVGAEADQLIAVQTYTGTLLMLLMLAEEVLATQAARIGSACLALLPALSAYIEQCLDVSGTWRGFLDGPGPLYLLGRGPALASVHASALLLHETAKVTAVGMSSGQFRHGPVEIVTDASRAVVFGTPSATRAMDQSLAGDIFRMGASVRWIGPGDEAAGAPSLAAWPSLGDETLLAPLFEIVPLQVAAYRLALWRGIQPGDFRYASEITSAESGFPVFETKALRT